MKKKLIIVGSVVVALLATSTLLSAQSPSIITRDQAKEIALKQVSGVIEEIELEKERGSFIYEVEIEKNNSDDDFTVKIDAKTGKVLSVYEDDDDDKKKARTDAISNGGSSVSSHEVKQSAAKERGSSSNAKQVDDSVVKTQGNSKQNSSSKQPATEDKSPKARTMLTKEQAKKIALDAVGGKIVEVERDKDNGRVIYEIEVKVDKGEYELEIDAYTGKIIDKDYDRDDDHDDHDDDDNDDDNDDDDDDDDNDNDDRYDDDDDRD